MTHSPQRRALLGALGAASGLAASGLAGQALAQSADNYPTKPIKLIVAFGAGSGNDLMAREIAQFMTPSLGQPVVVENRAGAGGVVGTDAVAKSEPDGYTIGLGTSSQLVMNPGLYKTLPFDVERDLAPIGLIGRTPLVLVANPRMPSTLRELIALARANPGKLTYGSGGNGSISHIVAENFKKQAGVFITHIPYRGNGPAMNDLIAGHIDLLFDGIIVAGPLADQGRVRMLAISGNRSPRAPNLPTFAESGMPNYEAYTWNNLFAPARTPPAVVAKLNAALRAALQSPQVKTKFDQGGNEIIGPGTPAEAETYGKREREKWVTFIRGMNLKLD